MESASRIQLSITESVEILVICKQHGLMEHRSILLFRCLNCRAMITDRDVTRLVIEHHREHPEENPIPIIINANTAPRTVIKKLADDDQDIDSQPASDPVPAPRKTSLLDLALSYYPKKAR